MNFGEKGQYISRALSATAPPNAAQIFLCEHGRKPTMRVLDWLKSHGSANCAANEIDRKQSVTEAPDAPDPYDPFPAPVTIEIRDVFDLHTINPRDVRPVVEEYLRQARAKNFPFVRIIHGKGVQRELVRKVLARTPFVINYADAPPEAGGWGATVAQLLFDSRKE